MSGSKLDSVLKLKVVNLNYVYNLDANLELRKFITLNLRIKQSSSGISGRSTFLKNWQAESIYGE